MNTVAPLRLRNKLTEVLCGYLCRYRWNFKIKYEIPLKNVWMGDCTNKAGEAINAPKSFVLGWPTVNFVANFNSSERRDKWHAFLERYIDLAKEKEQPKTIPLKIFTEDINNCASSITIKILNTHTVNDVINLSLSKLGITGSEKDYQLWVTAGKKNASYPLIGHEHPFGIKTSHLPATALLPQGPEDSASPSALLEAILLEKRSPDTQGQFVLKPRHPARSQQRRGEPLPSLRCLLSAHISAPETRLMQSCFSMWGCRDSIGGHPVPTQAQAQRNPKCLKPRPNS
ncbi:rho GTPase-activating protein 20-like [Vicugna pacos]|uniref:Rho GTPase-activating protein 20-like n=1 Tax=Vicugna pacos TaxID=30538 RepID=A0ABM5C6L6_VICPA